MPVHNLPDVVRHDEARVRREPGGAPVYEVQGGTRYTNCPSAVPSVSPQTNPVPLISRLCFELDETRKAARHLETVAQALEMRGWPAAPALTILQPEVFSLLHASPCSAVLRSAMSSLTDFEDYL